MDGGSEASDPLRVCLSLVDWPKDMGTTQPESRARCIGILLCWALPSIYDHLAVTKSESQKDLQYHVQT